MKFVLYKIFASMSTTFYMVSPPTKAARRYGIKVGRPTCLTHAVRADGSIFYRMATLLLGGVLHKYERRVTWVLASGSEQWRFLAA